MFLSQHSRFRQKHWLLIRGTRKQVNFFLFSLGESDLLLQQSQVWASSQYSRTQNTCRCQAFLTLVRIQKPAFASLNIFSLKRAEEQSSATMNFPGGGDGIRPLGIMGNPTATDPQQIQEQQMIKTVSAKPSSS